MYDSTIWLAKWRQRLVAQRPTVIKTVKIGQEYHAAAHFMDVMTHPDVPLPRIVHSPVEVGDGCRDGARRRHLLFFPQ